MREDEGKVVDHDRPLTDRANVATAQGTLRGPVMGVMGLEAGRQSACGVLLERAAQLRREANQLEALARAIPENFPADADQGLWNLAVKR